MDDRIYPDPLTPEERDRAKAFDRFVETGVRPAPKPAPDRFFIDSLTLSGEVYLIPAARRAEWDAFDAQCEETCEDLPVPEWAKPIGQLNWLEFEAPEEIFK
jgi:hypothetical protein